MTMCECFNCGRYLHISKMGFIRIHFPIKNIKINKEVCLCKWCLTKAGIKYNVDNDYVKIDACFTGGTN
jgi:hypothetical protein